MRRAIAPRQLCSRLPPYTVVASIVCGRGRKCGIALSDPYLSCAQPFAHAPASLIGLQSALRGVPVGGLLLCLPMIGTAEREARLREHSRYQQHRLARSLLLLAGGLRNLPLAFWDLRQSVRDIRRLHSSDSQWEPLDLSDLTRAPGIPYRPPVDLRTQAAVALQSMLLDYCDGWPNTFG